MEEEMQKFQVYGELIIPIYFPITETNKQAAMILINKTINQNTVTLLDGDLHTSDGKCHVVIAPKCRFNWIEVVSEYDI